VPEANAREAAVVEGVSVFGLKSLPQAADLVNAPESFQPVREDAQQMLYEVAQSPVDLRDVQGEQAAKTCTGGRRCRRPQHFVYFQMPYGLEPTWS
jgi:magnesium chelatase family protein